MLFEESFGFGYKIIETKVARKTTVVAFSFSMALNCSTQEFFENAIELLWIIHLR